jgi:hypothetical protein
MPTVRHEHPLQRFWVEESRWYDPQHPVPELALSEGQLCIDTWKLRSITYQGIADAMAAQWG